MGSLQRSPIPLSWILGPTYKGREGTRGEGMGVEGNREEGRGSGRVITRIDNLKT